MRARATAIPLERKVAVFGDRRQQLRIARVGVDAFDHVVGQPRRDVAGRSQVIKLRLVHSHAIGESDLHGIAGLEAQVDRGQASGDGGAPNPVQTAAVQIGNFREEIDRSRPAPIREQAFLIVGPATGALDSDRPNTDIAIDRQRAIFEGGEAQHDVRGLAGRFLLSAVGGNELKAVVRQDGFTGVSRATVLSVHRSRVELTYIRKARHPDTGRQIRVAAEEIRECLKLHVAFLRLVEGAARRLTAVPTGAQVGPSIIFIVVFLPVSVTYAGTNRAEEPFVRNREFGIQVEGLHLALVETADWACAQANACSPGLRWRSER